MLSLKIPLYPPFPKGEIVQLPFPKGELAQLPFPKGEMVRFHLEKRVHFIGGDFLQCRKVKIASLLKIPSYTAKKAMTKPFRAEEFS